MARNPNEVIRRRPVDMTHTGISSGSMPMISGLRGLPISIDDAERDFGYEIYDRMLNEPYLAAAVALIKIATLSEPISVEPAVPMPDEPLDGSDITQSDEWREYATACEVASVMRANIDQLGRGTSQLRMFLFDMLESITHGHRVAEITEHKITGGTFAGRQFFKSIRPIPRNYYRLVTDVFNNLLGVMSYQPGKAATFMTGLIPNEITEWATFTDIEKLFVLSFRTRNGSPLGTSVLRPAYAPWWEKQNLRRGEISRIGQFGGEQFVIIAPDEGGQVHNWATKNGTSADGTTDSEERALMDAMAEAATNMASGTAAVFPHGTLVQMLGSVSGADLFESKEGRVNREMAMTVLVTARTIMESNRNSQADAGAANDLFDMVKSFTADWLAEAVQEQLIRPSVRRNYGDEMAEQYTPVVTLAKANQADISKTAQGLARLADSGMITKPMLPHVWRDMLGIRYIPGEPVKATVDRAQAEGGPENRTEPDEDEETG